MFDARTLPIMPAHNRFARVLVLDLGSKRPWPRVTRGWIMLVYLQSLALS